MITSYKSDRTWCRHQILVVAKELDRADLRKVLFIFISTCYYSTLITDVFYSSLGCRTSPSAGGVSLEIMLVRTLGQTTFKHEVAQKKKRLLPVQTIAELVSKATAECSKPHWPCPPSTRPSACERVRPPCHIAYFTAGLSMSRMMSFSNLLTQSPGSQFLRYKISCQAQETHFPHCSQSALVDE